MCAQVLQVDAAPSEKKSKGHIMFVTQKDKEKVRKQLLASSLVSSRFKSVVREATAAAASNSQQQQQQHARTTEKTAAQVSICEM